MMSAQVTTKVTVNAAPEHVFKFISHLEYHTEWNPKLDGVLPPSGELRRGSEYQSTSVLFGVTVTAQNKITKCVPGRELAIENVTGALHYDVGYKLTDVEGRTLVTCTIDAMADSKAFAFTKPVLKKLARAGLQADLRALKRLAEQKTT